jgi:hypothetical protein
MAGKSSKKEPQLKPRMRRTIRTKFVNKVWRGDV